MSRRQLSALLLAATFISGCVTGRPPGGESPRAALERAVANYNQSTDTRSPDRVVAQYRADVVVLSPQSREPVVGVEANRANWARFYALPKAEHRITTSEIVMSEGGDMAYTRGGWTATFERPDGSMNPGTGELITIWRRAPGANLTGAGEWRVAAVMAQRVR